MDHIHLATNGNTPLGGQLSGSAETDWKARGFKGPRPEPQTPSHAEGGWVSPIQGGSISSEEGWRFHPILHYTRCHQGADISAGSSTPIRAASNGTIKSAGPSGGWGNYTLIDHGDSIVSGYAHQSTIKVKAGQTVKTGQTIGEVGSTGLSSGPHLHFNIFVNGKEHNPRGWIDNKAALRKPVCV